MSVTGERPGIPGEIVIAMPGAIACNEPTFERAEQIYATGKYQEAVALLQALASKGNAQAADRLALIYEMVRACPLIQRKRFNY